MHRDMDSHPFDKCIRLTPVTSALLFWRIEGDVYNFSSIWWSNLKLFRILGVMSKKTGIMEWKVGMKVETLSEDKGFAGAWSEGIVKAISSSSNGSVFFDIQYDNL